MPIYAYRCASCGYEKDVLRKVSDPLLTVCPACQAETFQKQVTAAGFQLKGSGWYATDFRGGSKPKGDDAGGGSAESADSAKGDAATAAEKPSGDKPAADKAAAAPAPAAAPAAAASKSTPPATGS